MAEAGSKAKGGQKISCEASFSSLFIALLAKCNATNTKPPMKGGVCGRYDSSRMD